MIKGHQHPTKPDNWLTNGWYFCACGAKNYTITNPINIKGFAKCWHCKTSFNFQWCRSFKLKYDDERKGVVWRYYSTIRWYIWRWVAYIHKRIRKPPKNIFWIKEIRKWGEI